MKSNVFELLLYLGYFVLMSSGFQVVISRNPVYSAISLIMCFFVSSIILLLLECEFLALLFVIIYVGAIAVLLLFIIMMLDIKFLNHKSSVRYIPFGGAFVVICCFEFFYFFSKNSLIKPNPYGPGVEKK